VRSNGEVKVLDFGLAKSVGTVALQGSPSSIDSFTVMSPEVTQAGVILGTAAYMAPEQAKGLAVDRRADIWAFGCVLFELLAGRRVFSGATVTDVLAAVLTQEPDWHALPSDISDSVRRLLKRCLQKDPRQRLHDIVDARLELDDALVAPQGTMKPRRRTRWALGAGTVGLAALAVVHRLLFAHDGGRWYVVGNRGTRRLTRRVATSKSGGDVRASDGRLAYFRLTEGQTELVTAALDGSSNTVVASFNTGAADVQHPRWSPDGKWIAYQQGGGTTFDIHLAPTDGGAARQLTNDAREITGFAWLPDSSGLLYSSTRGETMLYLAAAQLWHVAVGDGRVHQMTWGEASYVYPDIGKSGAVVVGRVHRSSDIWRFSVGGSAHVNVQHAQRVTHQTGHVLTPTGSPDGREVAYLSDRGGHANLWVVNLDTGVLRQITKERDADVVVGVPSWSPAGGDIAFVSSREAAINDLGIWLVNPDGSNLRRLVSPGVAPVWSEDGRSIYYEVTRTSNAAAQGLFKITEGSRPERVRTDGIRNTIGSAGTTRYFRRGLVDGLPQHEIVAASPEDGPFRVLARLSASRVATMFDPTLSPDGKWMAQALFDGVTTNIWGLSTSTGEWRQITDFAGRPTFIARRVSWSSDSRSVLAAVAEGDADILLLYGLLKGGRP
jgi:Tol biopolymer transport system component